jgi:GT2 family glycosyltransferase
MEYTAPMEGNDGRKAPHVVTSGNVSSRGASIGAAPSVALLTVNTDGGAFIEEFAASLKRVTYANMHPIIVDNASTDGSLLALRRAIPDAVILANDANLGFTGACNRGLAYCLREKFDYVLFLNSDLTMEPGFIDHLVAAADERTMTVPLSYLYHHPGRLDDSVGEFDWQRGVWKSRLLGERLPPGFDTPRCVDNANLSCVLVPTNLLHDIGLLDDNFFIYYDDTDFVRRAQEHGYRLWFVPQSVIYHRKGATIGGRSTPFGLYYLTRNRPYLIRKHVTSPLQRSIFWTYFLMTRAIQAALLVARGKPDHAKAMVMGLGDYWRGRMGRTVERDRWPMLEHAEDPGLRIHSA